MKLTPWFPADVKPVRAGVYEVNAEFHDPPWYRYWNGEFWHAGGHTPEYAAQQPRISLEDILLAPWRGLAEEPK
jgi:hypothetical protein